MGCSTVISWFGGSICLKSSEFRWMLWTDWFVASLRKAFLPADLHFVDFCFTLERKFLLKVDGIWLVCPKKRVAVLLLRGRCWILGGDTVGLKSLLRSCSCFSLKWTL